MPNIIGLGVLNVNTPQQNGAVFVGQVNMTGWDANQKLNLGHGGMFGIFNWSLWNWNTNFDGLELADGNMADQDMKAQLSATF